jgi:glycosyltransferase involved in cell wall biosynthesis
LNILGHINQKITAKKLSLLSRIGLSIDLLSLLKTAEKTFVLAVSYSVVEDFSFLNSRIKFITITPGNGIDLSKFSGEISKDFNYHGVFFARLVPEKGLFDLIEIWESVIKKLPNAKLAVCGIGENAEVIHKFLKNVADHNLKDNIDFLGQQESRLNDIVKHSYLTVYPSYADSFSLVTLESLACGTPVVAYDIPAIKYNFGRCKAVKMSNREQSQHGKYDLGFTIKKREILSLQRRGNSQPRMIGHLLSKQRKTHVFT